MSLLEEREVKRTQTRKRFYVIAPKQGQMFYDTTFPSVVGLAYHYQFFLTRLNLRLGIKNLKTFCRTLSKFLEYIYAPT